jgi:hypothetical protein
MQLSCANVYSCDNLDLILSMVRHINSREFWIRPPRLEKGGRGAYL